MGHEVLVNLTRGERVESAHRGAYCVVVDGRVDRCRGDIEVPVYFRSAAKPIQAIAVLESGAPERFGFSDEELAMVVGSHSGSPHHVAAARSMLKKIGVEESILRCGGHRPLDRMVYEQYVRAGYHWGCIEDNCSGKHSGMIGAAKAWGGDPARYAEPGERIQRENLANVSLFTGVAEGDIGTGTDGCAVPSFAVGVRAMALSMARITSPDSSLPDSKAAAARRMVELATRHPEMIAGENRFDTVVMRLAAGALLSKEGAEGVQIIGVAGRRIGIAIKIEDGRPRAQQAVAAVLLKEYGLLDHPSLSAFGPQPVLSREGDPVGRLEVVL